MLILILMNTSMMASYSYMQSDETIKMIASFDIFFDISFFLEMVLKIAGLGFKNYLKDRWNVLDAVIVLISRLDTFIEIFANKNDEELDTALKFLRLLRLLRMMKIARYFSGMRNMLRKTSKSLKDIGPFAGLLGLFIYLFTLIGRELFAYKAALNADGDFIYGE